ncbi:MAG: RNA polymerase Rpb4 [Cenarchaeum symbiont of Oopsacas minuta]|nr:RNA polymerase Rpb4 [Cenarchaeum symbiont of Oopsacas minuta]
MEEIKKKQPISISEVKGILSKSNIDDMDQFQRWTFDYVTKFSVLEPADAKKIRQRLVKECKLTEEESAEIVNIGPSTLAELRAFTFGWKKLILAETLDKMLAIIKGKS